MILACRVKEQGTGEEAPLMEQSLATEMMTARRGALFTGSRFGRVAAVAFTQEIDDWTATRGDRENGRALLESCSQLFQCLQGSFFNPCSVYNSCFLVCFRLTVPTFSSQGLGITS